MATWLLSRFVAMCVETCGFATRCWKTHCNGCITVPRCRGSLCNIFAFCSLGPQCHCGWWKLLAWFAAGSAMISTQTADECLRITLSSLSCQCGPKELPKHRHIVQCWKKHAAVDAGLCVSDLEITINVRFTVVKLCRNAWTSRVSYHNTVNIIWSICKLHRSLCVC